VFGASVFLGSFFNTATDMFSIESPDGRILWLNPAWEKTLGWSQDELLGHALYDFIHPDDRERVRDLRSKLGASQPICLKSRYRCKQGGYKWVESSVALDPALSLVHAVGREGVRRGEPDETSGEVGASKSGLSFGELFEAVPDAVVVVSEEGKILLANAEAARTFGYERGVLEGLGVEELVPEQHRSRHVGVRTDYVGHAHARRMGRGLKLEAARRDGSVFPVDVSLGPIEYHGTPAVLSIVRDMSTQRKLEDQLRQSQKMDAIGRLAGGVAHDFNNVLTVILSYSTMLVEDLTPDNPIRGDVEQIRLAAKQAAELTNQLLAFGRQQILQPRALNLNTVVGSVEKMLRRLLGESIELAFFPGRELWSVKVDASQIEQVVVNLAVNARDAMPNGGKLTIELANIDLDDAYVAGHPEFAPGPHVRLAVSDTGAGMDKARQARIFEPFFTTKEVGKGTGLGLATVFGIVRQSGGFISVYSEPHKGTIFKVYFPAAQTPAEPAVARPSRPSREFRGTETVLLVEDEESVRTLARAVLERNGYHVLAAQNGAEALRLCEQNTEKIDLLLTDVVMPRMSGRELAERVLAICPTAKVLYMSGYTDNSIVHHGVLDAGVAFLQKPFTPATLTGRVRDVLDLPSAP
jgi:two-component system, cell cycle sensor histidine kinase and response regulator CckA